MPGRIANPVWVDDERFDISYHMRRSALPRPGSQAQLEELVAREQARRLDRSRPLWELIVVEGLQDGGFAVVTKVHQTLVDGVHAVDLGQVVLDDDEDGTSPRCTPGARPRAELRRAGGRGAQRHVAAAAAGPPTRPAPASGTC